MATRSPSKRLRPDHPGFRFDVQRPNPRAERAAGQWHW